MHVGHVPGQRLPYPARKDPVSLIGACRDVVSEDVAPADVPEMRKLCKQRFAAATATRERALPVTNVGRGFGNRRTEG
jgi:hypothetical protein